MSSPSKPLPEQAATEKSTGEMSTKQGKTDPGWTSYYGPETKRSKRERRRPSLLDLSANDISDSSQTSSKPFLGSVPNPTPTDPRINHPYYNKAASNTKYEASHGTPKVALPGLPTQYPQRPAVPVYGRSFLPGHSVFPNYTFPPGLSQRDHFGFGSPTQPLQSYPTGNPFSYPSMHFPQPPTAYASTGHAKATNRLFRIKGRYRHALPGVPCRSILSELGTDGKRRRDLPGVPCTSTTGDPVRSACGSWQ